MSWAQRIGSYGDAQRPEDVDVEVLFAEQQLVDAPQELAALGALMIRWS